MAARKSLSHNFFGILFVSLLAVYAIFLSSSSNTGVMALRNLPIEFDMFEQILLPDLTVKSCGYVCNTDEDCKPLTVCSSCHMSLSRGRLACIVPRKST
ncbi:hypothetical protein HAX54_046232 [Datura stramonium]|uniref:Carboxypeptidase A inhibitor-like domain-containing protein n=1 Tax=Datura stramonium TaxID=4076 RepID=A0ABS8SSL3_DATST|nr:hypothetical protein [Datura stramonium]